MENALAALRAAGEPTRIRLLALCAESELTVSELTQILGQSQPRVSRHLKLLCDAGLLDRYPEGAWVFYRLAETGEAARLAQLLLEMLPADDRVLSRDRNGLEAIRRARVDQADAYFRVNAEHWDEIRSLYVSETDVEQALLAEIGDTSVAELLDIGTGTGRMLELLAPRIGKGIGIDINTAMLTVARSTLEQADISHCQVRRADMYRLPLEDGSVDLVTVHQVLHFADDPVGVLREAARVLRPGGRLVVVDFAPHDLEFLRAEHAHRRLGFSAEEVRDWSLSIGLEPGPVRRLQGDPLTVHVWPAIKPTDAEREVAA